MPFDFDLFDAILLDLDGTIYHEEHALPGAVELIRRLQVEGRKYACLTNSTSNPERIAARLQRMGVEVDPAHIYTAAAAACDYVMERFGGQSVAEGVGREEVGNDGVGAMDGRIPPLPPHPLTPPLPTPSLPTGSDGVRTADGLLLPLPPHPLTPPLPTSLPRVFNLSTEGVHDMLDDRVRWVQDAAQPCDAVIVGVPLNVYATEERQRAAMILLRRGATLVGICADRVYPSPRGLEFGVGATSAMLAYAASTEPVFCGKPEKFFFEELCRRLDVRPSRCVLFGDNLESDIAGAKGVGMKTVLVLTGVASREDVARLPEPMRPDWVIEGLPDLL